MTVWRESRCRWPLVLTAALAVAGGSSPNLAAAENQPPPVATGSVRVFEAPLDDFSLSAYKLAVENLLTTHEKREGRGLLPGTHRRAGLKVYADSGAGLSTPRDLVRGVIMALERRGFSRDGLFIVDLNASRLRDAGFLPLLGVGGDKFEGVPVLTLDTGRYYDPAWFYDSPLPATQFGSGRETDPDAPPGVASEEERRSLLPVPLMFDVDFWINLPGCSDHPILGVNGALTNATLWNASNTQRFFRSPANGPAAAAEIAAIPELRATWACTILSLERFQFIGGPVFNSLYTSSEPRLWLSDNPVLIDALMRDRINTSRTNAGFRELARDLRLLSYGEQVGLGSGDAAQVEWVPVPSDRAP
jgi:hypothetical protein